MKRSDRLTKKVLIAALMAAAVVATFALAGSAVASTGNEADARLSAGTIDVSSKVTGATEALVRSDEESSLVSQSTVGEVEALVSGGFDDAVVVLQAQEDYSVGPYTSGAITYYLNSDRSKARITGYEVGDAVSVTLPSSLNGASVAVIGENAFKDAENLKQVSIRGSVATIESNAFKGCKALQTVELPDTVTSIGDNAFESCEQLTTMRAPGTSLISTGVHLPAQLKKLGGYVFKDCKAIAILFVPKTLETSDAFASRSNDDYKGPFYGCEKLSQVSFEEGTTRACGCLLAGCPGIKKIVTIASGADAVSGAVSLPASVKTIGKAAFANCENLTSVQLAGSVATIEERAFQQCVALETVGIADGVTTIGDNAFELCEKLTTMRAATGGTIGVVRLPAQLEELGSYAFKDCKAITSLFVPKSLKASYAWASRSDNDYKGPFFGCEKLSQVSFEEGTTKVCNCLLAGCSGIKKVVAAASGASSSAAVVLPSSVETIGGGSFANCENLVSVQLSSKVKTINGNAFQQCGSLESVALSKVVESIGEKAFEDCSSLKTIDIPLSTKTIGDYAFRNCSNLTTVTFHGAPDLGKNAFEGCNKAEFINTLTIDSDVDGLPDEWEREGVTFDGEFIDLPAMGADPKKQDLFVEVDWMVAPSTWIAWYGENPAISLAPSSNAMHQVYCAFQEHAINLHIDAGPSSTDFVTGKKWGVLSGGNEVNYEKTFVAKNDGYKHWEQVVSANFSNARSHVFRHCLFVDSYDSDSSGIARSVPGQYFIVANNDKVRAAGDNGVARTFMHELGHTLGLRHGGNDEYNYKPNYLSVMNYMFQERGLWREAGDKSVQVIDYSDYALPDLNEWLLDENAGIDPNGLTNGTGLLTWLFSRSDVLWVANEPIDFNDDGQYGMIAVHDLNGDGKFTILAGWKDWDNLVLKAGSLGTASGSSAGVSFLPEGATESPHEATFEELLDAGMLGSSGSGSVERVSAMTVFAGESGQNMRLRVTNWGPVEATFKLNVQGDALAGAFSQDITLPGSVGELAYKDVSVPLSGSLAAGSYTVTARLSYQGRDDVVREFPIEAYQPTDEEKRELLAAVERGELDGVLSDQAVAELKGVLSGEQQGQQNNGEQGSNGQQQEEETKRNLADYKGKAREAKHSDLVDTDWYMKVPDGAFPDTDVLYIDYTIGRGLMSGYNDGSGRFDPWGEMGRGMAITVIYRMATGATAATTDNVNVATPFSDVHPGDWYAAAAAWGYENNITTGYTDGSGRFGPNDPVTREQLVTMIARYCESQGMAASDKDVSMFNDRAQISSWALDGVAFCYSHGIVSGMGDTGNFAPGQVALRAQMSKIIAVTARMLE